MSVTTDPELVKANGLFTTNAVANTQNTDQLVAAPAAGNRLRIYGISITWAISAVLAPPALNNAITGRTLTLSVLLGISSFQQPSDKVWFTNGVPLPAATALNFVEAATLASLNYYFGVHYVVEPV